MRKAKMRKTKQGVLNTFWKWFTGSPG